MADFDYDSSIELNQNDESEFKFDDIHMAYDARYEESLKNKSPKC